MTPPIMRVVQCWDDGVTTDIRLTEILRAYGAKATFNLNAGLHQEHRTHSFVYRDTGVTRLGWSEMKAVYHGFNVGNHSLTHPHLEHLPANEVFREVAEGRDRLAQFFSQPVNGFAYPFGTYSEVTMDAVRETGHVYGRTVGQVSVPFPPENAMAFHPCCHVLAPDFWQRYESAKQCGVFYFWGHSYELISEAMWRAFDGMIRKINDDPQSRWADILQLFT